jgi:hypothetical protein
MPCSDVHLCERRSRNRASMKAGELHFHSWQPPLGDVARRCDEWLRRGHGQRVHIRHRDGPVRRHGLRVARRMVASARCLQGLSQPGHSKRRRGSARTRGTRSSRLVGAPPETGEIGRSAGSLIPPSLRVNPALRKTCESLLATHAWVCSRSSPRGLDETVALPSASISPGDLFVRIASADTALPSRRPVHALGSTAVEAATSLAAAGAASNPYHRRPGMRSAVAATGPATTR